MQVLFVHQNFPGQFLHLAPALVRKGHAVYALKIGRADRANKWQGVLVHSYLPQRGTSKAIHPWISDIETKTIRGEAAWRKARQLRDKGFMPDVIYAHPGWGESLFLKEVWPESKLVLYGEFYYSAQGADMGFDPEFEHQDMGAERCRLQLKNLNHLAQLPSADLVISPTRWQASRFPEPWRGRIEVIHDGIDTSALSPNPHVTAQLESGVALTRCDEVITFVARHLEPYRGFHVFMRALPALLKARPKAHVLIVGEDGVSYGSMPKEHQNWRVRMLEEIGPRLDAAAAKRVHFLGHLERNPFTRVLQLSTVHVYLTYPFVLSWSLIEAMSIGCTIVASDTAPVQEVLKQGGNAVLVDFFDHIHLVKSIDTLLNDAERRERLSVEARRSALEHFDLERVCLPKQLGLLEQAHATAANAHIGVHELSPRS